MGCFLSCEECGDGDDNSPYSSPRPRNTRAGNTRYGFGSYQCPCCNYQWNSRRAWPNEKQACQKCANYCERHETTSCSKCWVYPTGWRSLTAEELVPCEDPEKEHKQALCGKCKRLEYNCGDKQKRRNSSQVGPSRPRMVVPKRTRIPRRPPSYNAAMGHHKKFTNKRFRNKY